MKILVTGASGFIGGNITEYLAGNPHNHILATGRSLTTRFSQYSNVTYIPMDLSNPVAPLACDVCIHCAGLATDNSNKRQLTLHNVQATSNLLAALNNCPLLIFISSSSVYDFSDQHIKTEEDTLINGKFSCYGKSKLQAEALVQSSGIQSVYILRPRAVYGKGDKLLLPRITRLIKHERIFVPGALKAVCSLTHIFNLCEAVKQTIVHSAAGVHIYNIADKNVYELKSVFGEIAVKKCGNRRFVHLPLFLIRVYIIISGAWSNRKIISFQSLKYITENSILSIKKAQEEINYTGGYGFFESLHQLDL